MQGAARYGLVAIAVAVTAVLTWYAYQHGRADPARWTVLCLALAAPVHTATTNSLYLTAAPSGLLAVGCLAAVLGAYAVIRADRRLPWDALGAGVVAAGVAVHAVAIRHEGPWALAGSLLLVVGMCFALSAGLTRVLRTERGAPVEVAGSALLGLAAMLLAGQALGPLAVESAVGAGLDDGLRTVPLLACAAAVALVAMSGAIAGLRRRDLRDNSI